MGRERPVRLQTIPIEAGAETNRRGFIVRPVGLPKDAAGLSAFEGYCLTDWDVEEVVEPGVLEVSWMHVDPSYARRGYATAMASEAVREGKDRGFQLARMNAHSSRVILILHKLYERGTLTDIRMFADHGRAARLPTAELIQRPELTPRQAMSALADVNNMGFCEDHCVPTVIRIV